MRYAFAFLAAAAAATTLVAGAAASDAGSNAPLRLTSGAEIQRYLASIGVDPRTVVVQRGLRNYAGPNCPGKRWTCTTARRVVQIGYHQSPNVFECSPAGPGTNPATGTCVIVQSNTTAANVAVCRMQTTAPSVTQSCSITQTNEQGANRATVDLLARLRGASPHEGVQTVGVTQSNGSGLNNLNSLQRIDAFVSGGAVQKQEGHQDLTADQTTTSGNNNSQVKQFQVLRGTASVNDGLQQHQNADNEGPNLDADVEQDSTSGGKNTSLLDQGTNYNLLATSREGPVEQRQGSPAGGLRGNINQSSSGPSTSTNFQDEDLNAHATTPSGTLTQVQFGPAECCTNQLGNPNNVFDINQESMLFSDGGAQSSLILGSCVTSGTCMVDQVQRTDDDFETNSDSCTASSFSPTCAVFIGIECVPGEGCFPTEGGPTIVESRAADSRER
jgi:hypothetical protein